MSNPKPRGYWTLERCMEDAAQYSSRSGWKYGNKAGYTAAQSKGWLNQCCEHMEGAAPRPKGHWTIENCMEDALLYKTRAEWRSASVSAFSVAHRNGWFDQCCAHMEMAIKPSGHWNLENCTEDARQYSGRREWKYANPSAYNSAYRGGWLDQCCEHMERGGSDNDVVYIWRDAGSDLHKVGVTSARIGEERVGICSGKNGMDPRIVFMLKVDDARAVESELLKLGTDPELDSSIDGYTEFRRLTDAQLGQAVSIAYEAAIAA